MSHSIKFSGPFVKKFYGNNAGARRTDNPAYPAAYDSQVPSPVRRIYLVIQNNGTSNVNLTLGSASAPVPLVLYPGQSVSFDNYNGAFSLSSYASVTIIESFA